MGLSRFSSGRCWSLPTNECVWDLLVELEQPLLDSEVFTVSMHFTRWRRCRDSIRDREILIITISHTITPSSFGTYILYVVQWFLGTAAGIYISLCLPPCPSDQFQFFRSVPRTILFFLESKCHNKRQSEIHHPVRDLYRVCIAYIPAGCLSNVHFQFQEALHPVWTLLAGFFVTLWEKSNQSFWVILIINFQKCSQFHLSVSLKQPFIPVKS